MGQLLYLDTARLGRMSPTARQAYRDFIEMAGEEGGSLYFDRFLRRGLDALPEKAQCVYPGLACWHGLDALKRSLRTLAGGSSDLPVLVASRSAQLMKFAARLLFHPCRNVLVTDLGWPSYHATLELECHQASRRLTTVPVCRDILENRVGENELVDHICKEFARHQCDGLFLTAVSNLGIRLPVERIVRKLTVAHHVRFVVIDGAQDFCHVSADLKNEYCDLYLAGSHKWLGAYHPMGLAFYGQHRSKGFIETVLAQMTTCGDLDDPLLRFSMLLEADALDRTMETVNIGSLFSCQGAVADATGSDGLLTSLLTCRLSNLCMAAQLSVEEGWLPQLPAEAFRSGILLLQAQQGPTREATPEAIRSAFCDAGVALTAYEDGLVRLSMPEHPWQADELALLRTALRQVA